MEISNFGRSLADVTQPGSGRVESRALDQQDFLKIMIEQMRHQNPLEPQDNSEFFAQIAQFDTLDTMREIATALKSLTAVSELANASALVGRTVTAAIQLDADPVTGMPRAPELVQGPVSRITFDSTGPVVHVGDRAVPLSAVQEIA
jgi:flagellar basal-body rod modification protein FlgD